MKSAIVTGGSRGIGYGIATALSKNGYNLAIMGKSPIEKVKEAIASLENNGVKVVYFSGSIAESKDRVDFVNSVIEKFGSVDLLVNNAGVAPKVRMDMLSTTEESYDYILNANLKGTFFLTQLVANEMIKNKDTRPIIINVSSVSAYASSPMRAEYCLSKAGISMITKLYADRLAEFGINVYEIRPGIIKTDMTSVVTEKYDKLIAEGLTPIKRWGYPEDIAKAVVAISSGLFPFSTGEVINVDGGFHLRSL